jgi:50S ribosomal protein L4, bacterial/organelle
MELKVYNSEAAEVGKIEVPEDVFGREYNEPLIHQVVVAQLANKRQGTKSTLTRAEVRGGGIKPWRQKGTGRARQGSTRSPQWTHGGVVFAPKPRDYSKKINKTMRIEAMKSALSEKVRAGEFVVVDKLEIEPKTKNAVKILKNLGAEKRPLVLVKGENENFLRAGRNIEGFEMADAALVNVYEVVRAGKCIVTEDAVKALAEVYKE